MGTINYKRTKTNSVKIGNTAVGANFPVRIQSMTNTDTLDVEKTVEQCKKIIDAGADYVRLTTQTVKHAKILSKIKEQLVNDGYKNPLIADVHFNPKVAEVAATIVSKVRINPGNYTDKKQFKKINYSEQEYNEEVLRIKERLLPLLKICKKHNTAIRIGTNHGSLSDRIMSRYGDTAKGMVEATMEFLRICKSESFENLVISLKASNTVIMVHACRLLVKQMAIENINFPLHLGVTEAGNNQEGRIKSAAGIGALLVDGIGDTIRVSLTESPEKEIPVAKYIVEYATERKNHEKLIETTEHQNNIFEYQKRKTYNVLNIGGQNVPVVVSDFYGNNNILDKKDLKADYVFLENNEVDFSKYKNTNFIIEAKNWKSVQKTYPLFDLNSFYENNIKSDILNFLSINYTQISKKLIEEINNKKTFVLIPSFKTNNKLGELRLFFDKLEKINGTIPVVIKLNYQEKDITNFQIKSAVDLGILLIDGFADGVYLENKNIGSTQKIVNTAYNILQSTGRRISKTEYISCPSCGRTLFDMEDTILKIKEKTSHLKELKIAIMGCIVNGPGEMADADYGLVGEGNNKITLYKKKNILKKNILKEKAVMELILLIKQNGDWKEK